MNFVYRFVGEISSLALTTYPSENLNFDPSKNSSSQNTSGSILSSIIAIDLGKNDPATVTFRIIAAALSLLGLGFLILLIYAGLTWVMARGNEEAITKAKQQIMQAVIGFVIIFMALGIATLIFGFVQADTGVTPS